MPRNKGYAPMHPARSMDSPINTSSFKSAERPMPPPRYTAPPSRSATDAANFFGSSGMTSSSADRQMTVEMPLVSCSAANGNPRPSSSESNSSEPARKPSKQLSYAGQPLRRRLTASILSQEPQWSSLPEQDAAMEESNLGGKRAVSMDIHEKRKMMMSKMREHKTMMGPSMSYQSQSSVPQDLLERRRVLQRTLQKVQSVGHWASLPSAMNQNSQASPTPPVSHSPSADMEYLDRNPRPRPEVNPNRKLMRCNSAALVGHSQVKRRELPKTPTLVSPLVKQHSLVANLVGGSNAFGYRSQNSLVRNELTTIVSGSFDSNDSI